MRTGWYLKQKQNRLSPKQIKPGNVCRASSIEYRDALHLIAEGKVSAECLITGFVGLDGVENAFRALGNPEEHAKILIDPSLSNAGTAIKKVRR